MILYSINRKYPIDIIRLVNTKEICHFALDRSVLLSFALGFFVIFCGWFRIDPEFRTFQMYLNRPKHWVVVKMQTQRTKRFWQEVEWLSVFLKFVTYSVEIQIENGSSSLHLQTEVKIRVNEWLSKYYWFKAQILDLNRRFCMSVNLSNILVLQVGLAMIW